MRQLTLQSGRLRRVSGLLAAWLVLFLAACAGSPTTTPAPSATATGGASAKTAATAAPKTAATTAPSAAQAGTPKATDAGGTGGTPAPQATLVEPKELAGKGNPNAKVTIIEFSDFQ